MRHIEKSLSPMSDRQKEYIKVDSENVTVTFKIQSDPVSEVGIDGVQALDMLEYVRNLFSSLNEVFPCRENSLTITKIEEAIHWQKARTEDRQARNVEGTNQT